VSHSSRKNLRCSEKSLLVPVNPNSSFTYHEIHPQHDNHNSRDTLIPARITMEPLGQTVNTDAGLPPSSYIYKIISTAPRQDPLTYSLTDQLAFISSDDSLRFHTSDLRPDGVVLNANESITCLERANDAPSNVVATAGRDGFIRFWDKRSKQKVLEIESRQFPKKYRTSTCKRKVVVANLWHTSP